MQTRLTKRRLIVATLAVQGVLLALGWFTVFARVHHDVQDSAQRRVADASIRAVEQFSSLLASIPDASRTDHAHLQTIVEGLSDEAGSIVCLLDRGGRVLCHPDLRLDASLRGLDLLSKLARDDGSSPNATSASVVTLRYLPELDATLVAHAAPGAIEFEALERRRAVAIGLVGGVAILLISGAATLLLVRRYDVALAEINRGLEAEVERRVAHSLRATNALIVGLARLADARDAETGAHLDRIRAYAVALARDLRSSHAEITDAWIDRLDLAACLHDVGKVAVPDAILRKPGPLTPAERLTMQSHARAGAATLQAVRDTLGPDPLIDTAIDVTLHHHERWDGSGYPDALAGRSIPLAARIVALADFYDALTSDRVYRARVSHGDAADMIARERGRHFDPEIADAFARRADEFDAIRRSRRALPRLAA